MIDAVFLYFIANADSADALWLADLSENRGYRQILKAAEERATRGQVAYAVDRESQSVERAPSRPAADRPALRKQLEPALQRLKEFGAASRSPTIRSIRKPGESRSREAYCKAEALRHDPARRSSTRAMGRLAIRRLGGGA